MPKQNEPKPKTGSFRRDRGARSNTSGTSKSGSIAGKITTFLWGKKNGWDSPR